MKRSILIFFLLMGFTLSFSSSFAVTSKEVESDIMCICKDKCGKVLGNCTCGQADIYRKEIREMIAEGMNKKEIIDHYIGRFGEKVLAAPQKTGFNLTAWIVPFVAIFFGGWGINRVVQSWARKRDEKRNSGSERDGSPGNEGKKDPYKKIMEDELKDFE